MRCASVFMVLALHVVVTIGQQNATGETEHQCSDMMCMIECEFGMQKDEYGCDVCGCIEAPEPELREAKSDPCDDITCDSGLVCEVYVLSLSGHKIPKCIDPSLPEKCQPPIDSGSCSEEETRWYYKMETGECEQFVYKGCDGNENNFISLRACQLTCIPGTELLPGECPFQCDNECEHGRMKDEEGCDTCECVVNCDELMCMMECNAGFVQDSDGCDICECVHECPDPKLCDINCPYGMLKDEHDCQICECRKTMPCVEGLACSNYCEYGYMKTEDGCDTCNCMGPPCQKLKCEEGEICDETKNADDEWQAECVSLHDRKPWCDRRPMCSMFCEHGFASEQDGCPDCQCLDEVPKCTLQECTESCEHGNRYDSNGCLTCQCLESPCKEGLCETGCEVNKMENCPSCPATYTCLDEDSVRRIKVSLKFSYDEDHEFSKEHLHKLKKIYKEKISELMEIEKAYVQGLQVKLPKDSSETPPTLTLEFHIVSWGNNNLVKLYDQFKTKVANRTRENAIHFEEAELMPVQGTLLATYSSDPTIPDGEQYEDDDDSDDMTHMVVLIAGIAAGCVALVVIVIVIFGVIRSKSKKASKNVQKTTTKNTKVAYKEVKQAENQVLQDKP